jgi:hypothetical protein
VTPRLATGLLPRIERVLVERGDVVVVECPGPLTDLQERAIKRKLASLWPRNASLILANGMTLKIGIDVPDRPRPPRTRR